MAAVLYLVLLPFLGVTFAAACPAYLRVVHSYNPVAGNMPSYDVWVNGRKRWMNVSFRSVTPYIEIPRSTIEVGIRPVGGKGAFLQSVKFPATSSAYTVGFTGPLQGPVGQVLRNASPFVNDDNVRVPNPGRFYGLWYRWSETNLNIDFRAVAGNPPLADVPNAPDAMRLVANDPKTVIPYPELRTGEYSFYPVLINSSIPLFNTQRNETVRIAGLSTQISCVVDGFRLPACRPVYDVFALGASLLTPHTNNLALVATETFILFNRKTGCVELL